MAVRAPAYVGAGGHVDRQRAVPDPRCRVAADAGDRRAVAGRRAVGDAADGLGAAALGQQVEEVVADARGVVHVDVLGAAAPAVERAAVGGRVVHPAEPEVVLEVELLADEVVGRVVGVGGVELHHRAEDVGGRLVEAAGLTGVGEAGGVLGDAVRHLVAGHVERDERAEVDAVAVAVGHLGAVPEGVDVALAVVDAVVGALAVVPDAVAPVHGLEVVPRHVGAVLRVGAGGGAVAARAVAEGGRGRGEVVPVLQPLPKSWQKIESSALAMSVV